MDATELARIRNNPAFQELARKRSSFSWTLGAVMFLVYMGFIFLVAFDRTLVAQAFGAAPMTLAFPLGLGVIVLAIVLTGVYVVRANSEFDRLTRQVVGQAAQSVRTPVGAQLAGGVR